MFELIFKNFVFLLGWINSVSFRVAEHAAGEDGGHALPELPNFIELLNHKFHLLPEKLPPKIESFLPSFLRPDNVTLTIINCLFAFLIIFFLIILVFLATKKIERIPRGLQALAEIFVQAFYNIVRGILGEKYGAAYTPLIGTIFIYILCMNFIGLVPLMKSPIAGNISMPLSLAIIVFLTVQYHGIRSLGIKNYVLHFCGEPAWLAPLNLVLHLIGEFVKPASLTLRLFANITAEDTVIAALVMLLATIPFFIPIPAHALFFPLAILFSLIQAFVFSMLSTIYILLMSPHGHEEHVGGH